MGVTVDDAGEPAGVAELEARGRERMLRQHQDDREGHDPGEQP